MKPYVVLLGCLILATTLQAQHKKSNKEPLDSIALMEEFAAEMLKAAIEDYKPDQEIKPERLAKAPLPTDVSESKLKEMHDAFVNSFYFKAGFTKSELSLESDDFFYPDPKWITNDITWTKALDSKNKNYLKPEEPSNDFIKFSVQYNSNKIIKLTGDLNDQITKLEGSIKIKAPISYHTVHFQKKELNQPKDIDTLQAMLVKMDKNLVSIWINGDYEGVYLYPHNEKGLLLESYSNTAFNLKGTPKESSAFGLPKNIGPGSLLYLKVNGFVDQVTLVKAKEWNEFKSKLIVGPIPKFEQGVANLTKERHQPFIARDFTKAIKPGQEDFATNSHLSIKKETNTWEKTTTWRVHYQLPNDNVLTGFAIAEFKNISILYKGKVIKTVETEGYFDLTTSSLSFLPQDDEYKPLLYDEVRGEIHIQYPDAIKTVTIKKGEKKSGVEKIEGNKLILKDENLGLAAPYTNASELLAIRAYGKSAWPLKQDAFYSFHSDDKGSFIDKFYWGTVNRVEIDVPVSMTTYNLPFAIKKSSDNKPAASKKK